MTEKELSDMIMAHEPGETVFDGHLTILVLRLCKQVSAISDRLSFDEIMSFVDTMRALYQKAYQEFENDGIKYDDV